MVKSERNVNQRWALPPNQDPTLMAYPSNRTCWSLSGLPGSSCCCCNREVTGNSIRQEMLVDTLTHHVLLFATATNNAHNQMSFTLRGGGPDDRSRMTQLQRQKRQTTSKTTSKTFHSTIKKTPQHMPPDGQLVNVWHPHLSL